MYLASRHQVRAIRYSSVMRWINTKRTLALSVFGQVL